MQFECIFSWDFGDSLRQNRLPWYPFRLLTAFAATLPLLSLRDSSPKGAPFGAAVKFSATAKAVPLGKVA